jgi:uncharacterized membrane protein
MNAKRKALISLMWIVLGIGLLVACALTQMDSFYSGMGSAFIFVGALQLLRWHKYQKNEAYREKMDTERNDERNRYLAGKAWAWAGYLFVILCAIACIVLRILEQNLLSYAASFAICILVFLYWISYVILRRKY